MADQSALIVETTTTRFESDVIQRSRELPVVVDFWAPWCGPCRQLTPILEQLANEHAGKFALAKINIDEAPQIAGAFRVQSIPYVVALRDGQPINHFLGMMPEEQIREWIQNLLPTAADELVQEALHLEAENPAEAESKLREALQHAPDAAIQIHLARVLSKLDRQDDSRQIISELEQRGFLEPEAERVKSQLDLQQGAQEAGSVDEAREAVEAHPDDPSVRLKLADVLAVAQQYEEALDICLQLVQLDKGGIGQEAKETMIKIFDVLGPSSELASNYRRKLAAALY